VVTECNLQRIIRDIALCINFVMLEVIVPVKFSGTEGFPARRDRRYEICLSFHDLQKPEIENA
jgi:hypothetical protein